MKRKIIIKIILIVVLCYVIISFNYYIYMFIQSEAKLVSNSADFEEKEVFDFSKDYVETFFSYLQTGNYDSAFEMLHDNCKKDLFNSDIERFRDLIKSKYFNEELRNKDFEIKESSKGNVNNEKIFHAYYEVSIICNNQNLKNSSEFYKDKTILADVVKVNGNLKLVINLDQFKI